MNIFQRFIAIAILFFVPAAAVAQAPGGGSTTVRFGTAFPNAHQWTIFIYTPLQAAYLCTLNPCTPSTGWVAFGGGAGAAPGSSGDIILNISGSFGANNSVTVDGNSFVNALGYVGNGTGGYSLAGAYALVTDCSAPLSTQSSICFGLGGKIEGSEAGDGPFEFGRFGQITGAWLKLDSNNCLALGAGTVGPCAQNAGVLAIIDPASPSSPTKINIMKDWTSATVWEGLAVGWNPTLNLYMISSDHGSGGGSNYQVCLGAGGFNNTFWCLAGQGNFVCGAQNNNCDLGSVTNAQQIRDEFINGIIMNSGSYGQVYPNASSTGTEIGLAAKPTPSASPIQAVNLTTSDTTGGLGPVVGETNGSVTGAVIAAGGTSYVSPSCSVSAPSGNTGVNATCTATQSGGVLNSVTITNTGSNSGYQFEPLITITDSAGSGASVIPVVTATVGNAIVAQDGSTVSAWFDGSVTIKDWVVASTTSAGKFHDTGIPKVNPRPQGVQTYGYLTQNGSGAGFYTFTVSMGEPIVKEQNFPSSLGGTCPTSASINATCTSASLLWTTAFPDNSYRVSCTLTSPTGHPHLEYYTKLASGTGITLTIAADSAAAADAAADCIATHD